MKTVAIIPVYNEQQTILNVLENTDFYVDLIIVANDGSTDASSEKITEWVGSHDNTYYLNMNENKGVATAIGMGFYLVCHLINLGLISEEDLVINIDADGQHEPKEMVNLVHRLLENNCDLVSARRNFSLYPFCKILGNRLLSLFTSFLTGRNYSDVECGYKVLRAGIVPDIMQYYTGYKYSWCQELVIITGLLGHKIDNEYNTSIRYYRSGTKLKDAFTNLLFGFISFLKVKLNMKSDISRKISRVLEQLAIEPKILLL